MRVGVIDVGTNSVRLLVADVVDGALRDRTRDLTITRLGEGVDRTGVLGDEPLRRTVDQIAVYADRCRQSKADQVRVIATSAVRDARNRDAFVERVEQAASYPVSILSGDEEAQLGFRGASAAIDEPPPFLVLDIGGGSTELVRGTSSAERFISLDIGAVRLTERCVAGDPPSSGELRAIRSAADEHLARAADALGLVEQQTMVGLAGTITTATAIVLGLERYDRDAIHHARLTRTDVDRTCARLAAMTSGERRALPAMPRGREDVIVTGLVILGAAMDRFGAAEIVVSESDILDGTALDLVERAS